ncbi:MAG: tagaturonate reductase [Bacteroidota bacterium]
MSLPSLRRSTASPRPVRIIQFGEGNFLRAFADWMIQLMNEQTSFNSDIVVIQPIPQGRIEALNEQDGLYHVYLRGIKDGQPQELPYLVDVLQAAINPYTDCARYLKEAENPELRFVLSNTTESGIVYSPGEHLNDQPQSSFPGKLAAFLHHRYQTFAGSAESGLIFLPCELIDRNGDKLRAILFQIAEEWQLGIGFVEWLTRHCVFCNTLVDRIVPGFPHAEIEHIQASIGYQDHSVVVGEPFHLWVIEGPESVRQEFPAQEAGLNVIFTADQLSRYRTRKVRILNGAHTLNVPIGILYGLETVRETIEDSVVGPFLRKVIFEEIIPTLDLPKEELTSFAMEVIDRFRNPYVRHLLASIALNSISKYKTRDLPSLLRYHQQTGELPRRLCLGLSALIVFYRGEFEGREMPIKDAESVKTFFHACWKSHEEGLLSLREMVDRILGQQGFWDQDLSRIPGLGRRIADGIHAIQAGDLQAQLY